MNTIPSYGPGRESKTPACAGVFRWRGGRDLNPRSRFKPRHSLSRRAQSATLAPPHINMWDNHSGGSGIRTHGGLHHDGFQDRYLQPLGHPSERRQFYHKFQFQSALSSLIAQLLAPLYLLTPYFQTWEANRKLSPPITRYKTTSEMPYSPRSARNGTVVATAMGMIKVTITCSHIG